MRYLIFKGVSTKDLPRVTVSKMPSHKRAAMRYQEFYVVNRDGALHTDEGLSNIELTATLLLLDAPAEARQAVNAWAMGQGQLITSDDPSKAYKAAVRREIKWQRQKGNRGYFDTATVYFDCDPYMYEAHETEVTFTADGNLNNPGTAEAIPTIKVEGSGNASFTIGGQAITIRNMSSGVPVFLDCENGYVYASAGAMEMVGEFPILPTGQSAVTLGSGVTKITITPHWRWV